MDVGDRGCLLAGGQVFAESLRDKGWKVERVSPKVLSEKGSYWAFVSPSGWGITAPARVTLAASCAAVECVNIDESSAMFRANGECKFREGQSLKVSEHAIDRWIERSGSRKSRISIENSLMIMARDGSTVRPDPRSKNTELVRLLRNRSRRALYVSHGTWVVVIENDWIVTVYMRERRQFVSAPAGNINKAHTKAAEGAA